MKASYFKKQDQLWKSGSRKVNETLYAPLTTDGAVPLSMFKALWLQCAASKWR